MRAKIKAACAGSLLLLLGAAGQHLARAHGGAADFGRDSPVTWRAFEPLVVAFGDGFADPFRDAKRRTGGVARIAAGDPADGKDLYGGSTRARARARTC